MVTPFPQLVVGQALANVVGAAMVASGPEQVAIERPDFKLELR